MKLDRGVARALAALCRKHNVTYVCAGSIPSRVQLAYLRGFTTSNGMPYHAPPVNFPYRLEGLAKAYLIWRGETQAQIEESFAFLIMSGIRYIYLTADVTTSNADIVKFKQEDYH